MWNQKHWPHKHEMQFKFNYCLLWEGYYGHAIDICTLHPSLLYMLCISVTVNVHAQISLFHEAFFPPPFCRFILKFMWMVILTNELLGFMLNLLLVSFLIWLLIHLKCTLVFVSSQNTSGKQINCLGCIMCGSSKVHLKGFVWLYTNLGYKLWIVGC